MTTFNSSTYIKPDKAALIAHLLDYEPTSEDEAWVDKYPIVVTISFPNGFEMDVEACSISYYEEGVANSAWGQSVLFDARGNEVQCDDFEDSVDFFSPHRMTDREGNEYITYIILNKED